MKNKFLLALIINCCAQVTLAQTLPSYIKQGNQQFEAKNYYEAAQFYEKFITSKKKRTPLMAFYSIQKNDKGITGGRNYNGEVMYKLAESYRLAHDYKHAEKWYGEAAKYLKDSTARAQYREAVCMRANDKYTEATEMLTKLIGTNKISDQLRSDANRELDNLRFIEAEMNKPRKDYYVEKIPDSLHTSSYAMALKKDGGMIFTGIAQQNIDPKDSASEKVFTNSLYTTAPQGDFINHGRQVINNNSDNIHEGLASFSADGKRMYFTRWYKKEAKVHSAIYMCLKQNDGEWGSALIVDERINMANYNAAQPFITDNGEYLLYASDRPGGLGKYDLWCAKLNTAGNVLSTENMGPVINTAEDEFSPYFHSKSRTLVFSSNGRTGMGGFDIYSSQGTINFSKWEQPVNPGAPLNSSKDDMFFISTDKTSCWNTGYISSDRLAEQCCLAVYAVKQNNGLQVNGVVIDDDTKQPLAGVTVRVLDPRNGNSELQSVVTDEQGNYRFMVRNTSDFDVLVEKDSYTRGTNHISRELKAGEDTVHVETIFITNTTAHNEKTKAEDELKVLRSNTTYVGSFEFGKSNLNNIACTNLDSLASLMNRFPDAKIQLGGYTDRIGSTTYNLKLAQNRVDACIKYLVKKGIDKNRFVSKAFGECCPLQAETKENGKDIPAARKHNRRVEYIFLQ